jgi:hypothetical protein
LGAFAGPREENYVFDVLRPDLQSFSGWEVHFGAGMDGLDCFVVGSGAIELL